MYLELVSPAMAYQRRHGLSGLGFIATTSWQGGNVRRVGEPDNVQFTITGMKPGQVFRLWNQHESGQRIGYGEHSADASGNWSLFDTSIIGSQFIPGNYVTIVEAEGVQVNAGTFTIVAPVPTVPALQPTTPIAPGWTPPPAEGSGTGRITSTPAGVPSPIIVSVPGAPPTIADFPTYQPEEPTTTAGMDMLPMLAIAGVGLFLLMGRRRK